MATPHNMEPLDADVASIYSFWLETACAYGGKSLKVQHRSEIFTMSWLLENRWVVITSFLRLPVG